MPTASRRTVGQADRRTVIPCLAVGLLLAAAPVQAQRVGLLLLGDVEGWDADSGSNLLGRNGGDPYAVGRLSAWLTVRPLAKLDLIAQGIGEAATDDSSFARLEQLEARYALSPAFTLHAGKFLSPVGAFGRRRFSNVNPLIGRPDTYPPSYPWGAMVSGAIGAFDYRLAAVDEPPSDPRYLPEPDQHLRPTAAIGWRFGAPLRIGLSGMRGPYLGNQDTVRNNLPAGTSHDDFMGTSVGVDAHFSIGYLDAYGEFLWTRYEVPTAGDVDGRGWYVEAKYTLGPRVFVAARVEANDYVFVLPINQFFWVGSPRLVRDAELGAGYRFGPNTLLKLSYRRDEWPDPDPPGLSFPDGYAFALQLSHHMDVGKMLERRY